MPNPVALLRPRASLIFAALLLAGCAQSNVAAPPAEMQPEVSAPAAAPYRPSAAEQELADFTSVVLADTEDTWHALFQGAGQRYR